MVSPRGCGFLHLAYFHIQVFNSPFQSLLVSVKEHINLIALNRAAAIQDFYSFAAVTWDNHFSTERELLVGSYEQITLLYFVTTGSYTI